MTTRLITSYDEAKALKEAGWPQHDHDTMSVGVNYFYAHDPATDQPSEVFVFRDWQNDESGFSERDLLEGKVLVTAPRLDELLAFLWERGEEVNFAQSDDGELWGGALWNPSADCPLSYAVADKPDRLSVVVDLVVRLIAERTPSPPPQPQ